ncbi:MAG: response regulator [Alphaproteobacteria bacterium]
MTGNSSITILVAEDNDPSRELLMGILRSKGYTVYGAIDGETSIKVIEDRPVHLALVDVNMAPQGGLNFVRWLTGHGHDLPVIFVTADDNTDILKEATLLGVRQIMRKPVDPVRLMQTVERLLQMPR